MATNFDISNVLPMLRRNARLITACCLASGALGLLYVMTATRTYTATAEILVEQRQMRALRDVSTLASGAPLDSAIVESEAEVLRSEDVALAVVRKLKLADTPDAKPSLWKRLTSFVSSGGSSRVDPVKQRELEAAKVLDKNLRVSRATRTNILQIEYVAPDPVRAAEIANAFAQAYVEQELKRRSEAMRGAQGWLQKRVEELHGLSIEADKAVQKFKAEHNLLSSKGTLITEQQTSELTSQLVAEGAATAQARARYERLKSIIDNHQTDAAVTEALNNNVMSDLRTKYLEATRRKIDLERRLGPTHGAVVNQQHTVDELKNFLFQELGRIADSYRNEYEIAAAREKALAGKLAQLQDKSLLANDALVQLRHLEQNAENYKTLYQNYAQMYEEAVRQKGFPFTTGHVVAEAHPPLSPTHPRKSIILAACLGVGAMLGFGAAVMREYSDRVFRTGAQLREELGVDLIGMLPDLTETPADPAAPSPGNLMRYAVDNPLSGFTETLRSVKVAADLKLTGRRTKVIGVVSLLPDEGKTLIAKNFASLLAWQGGKALLVDADLRSQSLTRHLRSERRIASVSAPHGLWREPESGLYVMPCSQSANDSRIAEGLSPEDLRPFLPGGEQPFDYIVLDLPPMGPVVSARGLAPAVDAFLLIVKWGSTPRNAVRVALENERYIKDKLLGAVLNYVSMEEIRLYERPDSGESYHLNYSVYYSNNSGRRHVA